jgi:ribonuclease I
VKTKKKEEEQVNLYWPSLHDGNNVAFWKHEWYTHCTCTAGLFYGPVQYFEAALQTYVNHQIQNLFEKTKFLQQEQGTRDEILTAIKTITNVDPKIRCIEFD